MNICANKQNVKGRAWLSLRYYFFCDDKVFSDIFNWYNPEFIFNMHIDSHIQIIANSFIENLGEAHVKSNWYR